METGELRAQSVDCGALYEQKRNEFVALLRGLRAEELERVVAATPLWRVRDVLAHVVGITADLNTLNFSAPGPDEWTAAQVDARRSSSLDEIVAEWDRESVQFEEGLRLLGYEIGSHYIGDLHAHIQDVRSTLGLPADSDDLTVAVALDFYLTSLHETLADSGVGAVRVVAGSETHLVGVGEPRATVTGSQFEVLRALSGRRSRRQIETLDWSGDADKVVDHLSRYPMPVDDLAD